MTLPGDESGEGRPTRSARREPMHAVGTCRTLQSAHDELLPSFVDRDGLGRALGVAKEIAVAWRQHGDRRAVRIARKSLIPLGAPLRAFERQEDCRAEES